MKKKLFSIFSVLLFLCSFLLTGCLGDSGQGDFSGMEPPSDDLMSAADGAEDKLKTANNVTYYYNNLIDLNKDKGLEAIDRNCLDNCFSDAYLFIDPGSDQPYTDHLSNTAYEFYKLADRQISFLANTLYDMINRVYIDSAANSDSRASLSYSASSYKGDYIVSAPSIDPTFAINGITVIDNKHWDADLNGANDVLSASSFNVDNIATLAGVANVLDSTVLTTFINPFKIGNITLTKSDDPSVTEDVAVDNFMFDFEGAINGGKQLTMMTNATTGATYYDFAGTFDSARKWAFSNSTKTNLVSELKKRIASAVSGVSTGDYVQMVKDIDHLGFTEKDQENIANEILNNLIGKENVTVDNSYIEGIKTYFGGTLSLSQDNISKITEVFTTGATVSSGIHNYKAYSKLIPEFVQQATKMTCTYTANGQLVSGETLFPRFPRLQLIIIDSRVLMNAVDAGGIGEEEDEEIDVEDIPTDTDSLEFTEKLSQFVNLKSIMFLPKSVVGERTMAKKEGDEWLEDEDGNQILETFNVEGFLLTDIDIVLMAENNKTAVVQGEYTLKTKTKNITNLSEPLIAYGEKPDPTNEDTYSSTAMIDIESNDLVVSGEDIVKDYRIMGYNGCKVMPDGSIVSGASTTPIGSSIKTTMGDYGVFTFNTSMFTMFTADSANGADYGYSLNLDNFAGDNYVLLNFNVVEVDGSDQVRNIGLNILSLNCETT